MTNLKLKEKIFIEGYIKVLTGLHIGGSSSSMEIGGVDNDIVKTGNGIPYIPGSSLKGKLRSLLAKTEGSDDIKRDSQILKKIFGDPKSGNDRFLTRIMVRDCHLDVDNFGIEFSKDNRHLDFDYSEIKVENVIDRKTGSAIHPRHVERIPANAKFNLKIVLNVYEGDNKIDFLKKIKLAFDLLNMDYLGGSGSRGYGAVEVSIGKVSGKTITFDGINDMSEIDKIKAIFNL